MNIDRFFAAVYDYCIIILIFIESVMFKNRFYLYIFLSILVIATVVYVKKEFSIRISVEKRKIPKIPLTIKIINDLGSTTPASVINDILKEKYDVKISDENYDMIYEGAYEGSLEYYITKHELDPKIIYMLYTPEVLLPNLDNYDLTIGFDHVDDPRHIRVPWYYMQSYKDKIRTDYDKVADLGKCAPKKPYFACFLVSNNSRASNHHIQDGCVAREAIFNKLSEYKKVLSGGKALNNIGKVIPGKETMSWLSQCKFVISYENQTYDGYITEKPFQAYFAGSIPIYYGAKSAVQDINKKAIIYAGDFNSDEELVDYIKKVDEDDDLYCDIWNQNIMTNHDGNFEVVKAKLRNKIYEVIDAKLHKK